jgi:hypothetical protein
MRLTPPKKIVFWISVALAVVAVLQMVGLLGFIPFSGGWTALAAFVLLGVGNTVKGF